MGQHVVVPRLVTHLYGRQGRLERVGQLRVRGRERRGCRRGETAVAQKQAEGVGVDREVLRLELHELDKRKLVAADVPAPQVAEHLPGLERALLAVTLVLRRPD